MIDWVEVKRSIITAKSMGLSVYETNVLVTTAWIIGRREREMELVKMLFAPYACTLYPDGKKVKAKKGVKSNRCVIRVLLADGSEYLR